MLWVLKNRLDETVLLSTRNTFTLMDKKIIIILYYFVLLNWSCKTVVESEHNAVCNIQNYKHVQFA